MEKNASSFNIYDIAQKAGVSIATVSRVLSGSDQVREKTRQKVMAVVESTGYTPNAFARGLGLGTMQMVGILCTDVSDLYCANAVSILERLLRAKGLDTLLYCTGSDPKDKKRYLAQLLGKHVDAVLLVGSAFKEQSNNFHIEQAAVQAPVIIINGLVECPGVYCVYCDEFTAMRDNVRLLHDRGCKEILYVYDADTYSGMQKLAGFHEGLRDCGLDAFPTTVRCEKDFRSAMDSVGALLDSGAVVDGVLASEDLLAIGAARALAARGMRPVPTIGFNNSVLADVASPALSSVDNMVGALCQNAVDILDALLQKNISVPPRTVVSSNLVRRETFR